MKKIVVLGAGGFIGSHLVKHLSKDNYVIGIDVKYPQFSPSQADDFHIVDATNYFLLNQVIPDDTEEIYQLAADMGGAGYIFTGENDLNVMLNSATINLNVARIVKEKKIKTVFFSSSACIYPEHNQLDPLNPNCKEDTAYPANPDSEYGWEKLFSERLYLALARETNTRVRIARYHNIFGPEGTYEGGREKAPAALCRKVLQSNGSIDVWGDGKQTRSFLFIDDCIKGTIDFVNSDFTGPVNIGSEQMISITDLVKMISSIENKPIKINYIPGPTGVRGRNSDNTLYKSKVNAQEYVNPLKYGIEQTYNWIKQQVGSSK